MSVLKDNINSANSLVLSVCDAKCVCFIANCLSEKKWIEKKRKAYNYSQQKQALIAFLRTNFHDMRNAWMNGVDIVD